MRHLKMPIAPLVSEHPFGEFSCQIYKSAKEVLQEMQAHHGLNLNVILFCYWYSANYQKSLSKNEIKSLLTNIHQWHETITQPLCAMRSNLKDNVGVNWVDMIDKDVKDAELMAEKIEQLLIVNLLAKEKRYVKNPNTQKAVLSAFRGIKYYCEVLYITLNDRDRADLITIAAKIFPDFPENQISILGMRMLKQTPKIVSVRRRANLELFKS